MGTVSENLKSVETRIQAACRRAGRDRGEVKLVCVTKTKPIEMLQEAYADGQREFGENKVQEITWKSKVLPADVHWHMIGHLQTNKVKQVIEDGAVCIHSVDTLHLAQEISKRCCNAGKKDYPILMEVNVAREESKFGVMPEDTETLARQIATLPGIRLVGLMTSAPYTEDPQTNRIYFRELRELLVDINSKKIDNVNLYELSMGMTGDFEVAIEEGATIVRIGTAIFGERVYT